MLEFLLTLLCLGLVAVIAVVAYRYYRKRKEKEQRGGYTPTDPFADSDTSALRGDPRALKAGDIFDTHGETLTVRGSLRLSEGGYRWSEHLIDTGTGIKRWLSVEEDPDLELVLWTEVKGAPMPGPGQIEYDGKSYRLEETGRANYTSEATTGLDPRGSVQYHDYRASDDSRLSFEDFGGTGKHEAAVGLVIQHHEIVIYPQTP
ncbi:MAG TPA: DUF4178 domain-containing protein [Candidatus Stackebrandtia excrementipullorum]|nr:DUF4178 domain-containing protein [Candidatus Stackebrandtia excrementipullorum]